jgi:flagellar hook-associated protein 3 FlgL
MRISTSMMYDSGTRNIQRHQSELAELQAKVASGRRVLKPSDDPISAAGATVVRQAKGVNAQYQSNAVNAQNALAQEEDALAQATRVLQDVKTLTVQAGSAALQNSDRLSIATSLKGLYSELLGIANRTDGSGQYLFSGMQGGTQPFSESAPGVVAYAGDEGARLMQVGPQRRIAVGDNGAEIFQRIREGNGTFVANVAAGNTGSAVADMGTVTNPQAWANPANSGDYTIRFAVDGAGVTTYDIVDNAVVPPQSMLTGAAAAPAGPYARVYQAGTAISFRSQGAEPAFDAGVQLTVTGSPANGDTMAVQQSGTQDVFTSLHNLIRTLETGASTAPSSKAAYQNGINHGLNDIDRALDQVLTARSSIGSRLQELESLETTTEDMAVHYDEELSRLQDLDYAQALTDLQRRQFNLEAAQKSFMLVNSLSLFDLL